MMRVFVKPQFAHIQERKQTTIMSSKIEVLLTNGASPTLVTTQSDDKSQINQNMWDQLYECCQRAHNAACVQKFQFRQGCDNCPKICPSFICCISILFFTLLIIGVCLYNTYEDGLMMAVLSGIIMLGCCFVSICSSALPDLSLTSIIIRRI